MSGIYNRFKANLMNKVVDLEVDTIKAALVDSNHSFSATDNVWSDVSANEITGTGYTAGGNALLSKAVTQGATTKWDAADVLWTGAISTDHIVIYDDSVATDDLIASIDLGGTSSVVDGTWKIQWSTSGIIDLT